MHRCTHLLILAAFCASLASCYVPEPRPFAAPGGRSLDQPPRYGETNRYVTPSNPPVRQQRVDPDIDPRTVPPGANLTPPANLPPSATVDAGLTANPSGAAAAGATTTPAPTTDTAPAPSTTSTPPAPSPGDAPFARPVPGRPGFVYSTKDPKKVINVEGLRPGSKAKDPDTGEIFRVPAQ